MEKKKIILIIFSIVAILASILIVTNKIIKNDDFSNNPSTIKSKNLVKDKKINDLLISNVKIITKENYSTYTAIVTNNSKREKEVTLYITFTEDENEIKATALYKRKIAANDSTNIDITFDTNLENITNIEYTLE